MTGNALSGKGWGTVQSPEEPQIVQVFKYEAIRVYVFRTRKIKTALDAGVYLLVHPRPTRDEETHEVDS